MANNMRSNSLKIKNTEKGDAGAGIILPFAFMELPQGL
jgi:hypothetical protein